MERFVAELDVSLMDLYRSMMRMENRAVRHFAKAKLTAGEMNLIEQLCRSGRDGMTIGALASALGIARPSVTVAVNRLEQKGYVTKVPSVTDRRSVRVLPTAEGIKMEAYHSFYHRSAVKSLTDSFDEDEKAALMRGVKKLVQFFEEQDRKAGL